MRIKEQIIRKNASLKITVFGQPSAKNNSANLLSKSAANFKSGFGTAYQVHELYARGRVVVETAEHGRRGHH